MSVARQERPRDLLAVNSQEPRLGMLHEDPADTHTPDLDYLAFYLQVLRQRNVLTKKGNLYLPASHE